MYLPYFLASFILALLFTPLIRWIALTCGVVDMPGDPRKIHSRPTPLLGGLVVFISFVLGSAGFLYFGHVDLAIVPIRFFAAIFGASAVLMLGGILDDAYNLPPKILWLFPGVASLIVVASGIGVGITFLTNPFGGIISLKFAILGIPASAIFVWMWLMGMSFTTKLLDGLDGLASGIALIGGITLFLLSLRPEVRQPITATLAIIFVGALAGYLPFAFHPAKIFLGEAGSTFLGFLLGTLSVLSGAKIATALLVMGIPILDVAWAIARRLYYGKSPFVGDRKHLHFRLLDDLGMSHRQAVLTLYALSAVFGFIAVFLQARGKLIALFVLFIVMIALIGVVLKVYPALFRQKLRNLLRK